MRCLWIFLMIFVSFEAFASEGEPCLKYFYLDLKGEVKGNPQTQNLNWQIFDAEAPGFGFSDRNLWLKVDCHGQQTEDNYLAFVLDYAVLDRVEFYRKSGESLQLLGVAGDLQKTSGIAIQGLKPSFLISPKGNDETYFLKITTQGSLQAPLQIYNSEVHSQSVRNENFVVGMYYGVLGSILIYNLLLYLTSREKIFLIYSIFLTCNALFQLAVNGIWVGFFQNYWMQNQALSFSMFATEAMMIVFATKFLLNESSARWIKPFSNTIAVILFIFAVTSFLAPYRLSSQISALGGITIPVTILLFSFYSARRGNLSARLFTFAWLCFLLGALTLGVKNLGIIPPSFLSNNAIQIGSACEMIFLAVALGMRFRYLEDDNKVVEKRLLRSEAITKTIQMVAHDLRAPLGVFERMLYVTPEVFPSMKRGGSGVIESHSRHG